MKETIIRIISEINPYVDILESTDLISEEVLDSIGIVLLIQQIEENFDVSIPQEDINLEDFQNISSIMDMLERIKN